MIGVYKITNKINNKCYIGVSIDIEKRWWVHKNIYNNEHNKEYNKTLYRAFRKYQLENFNFEIIEQTEDIFNRERYWIKKFGSDKEGYNETSGGEFGSKKGHCAGELNGRSILLEEDVVQIRLDYSSHLSRKESYDKIKNKITFDTFVSVWAGKLWQHIMPEVFSEANKYYYKTKGCANAGESNPQCKVTEQDVRNIRIQKKNNIKKIKVYELYNNILTYSGFSDIWYNKSWKGVIV